MQVPTENSQNIVNPFKRVVVTLLVLVAMVGVGLGVLAQQVWWTQGSGDVVVTIGEGASAARIAEELKSQKVIQSTTLFRLYVRARNMAKDLHPGIFTLQKGMNIRAAAESLTHPAGKPEKTLKVIEGWTVREIAAEVERLGFGTQKEFFALTGVPGLDYRKHPEAKPTKDWTVEFPWLKEKPAYVSLEGYLFPNTYRVFADATPEEIVRKLLQEFEKQWTPDIAAQAKKLGRTQYQVVTMASIVESEVRGSGEMRNVADIFWRRLDYGWYLQADATVNYVTQKNTPSATYADLENNSPYNTYKHLGLPLGPIASPGAVALQATVTPTANDWWFYLTTPSGEVKYGKDFEEHKANRIYLR